MTDELDEKHQGRKRQYRAEEGLEVFPRAKLAQSHGVIIDPGANGERRRYVNSHRGRFKRGNNPNQVHRCDENEQCAEPSRVFLGMMNSDIGGLRVQEFVEALENMLQLARLIGRKGGT